MRCYVLIQDLGEVPVEVSMPVCSLDRRKLITVYYNGGLMSIAILELLARVSTVADTNRHWARPAPTYDVALVPD